MDEDIDKRMNRKRGFSFPGIDAKRETRLLQVWRDYTTDTVNYSLKTFRIADLASTRYRALSYTWGYARTANDVKQIQIDGQPFAIRRNLHAFLRTTAGKGKFGLYFIDAVCINQLDHGERQAQVQEMAGIFRNADEVIAWLGYPRRDQLENLRALCQTLGNDCADWTQGQWEALKYLSYHPYWSRIWVLQEVVLASHLVIWCGFSTFSVSLFRRASRVRQQQPKVRLADDGRPSTITSPAARLRSPAETMISHRTRQHQVVRPARDRLAQGTKIGTIDEMKTDLRSSPTATRPYQSRVPEELYQVVTKFGKLNCSDPRDRLYGFLGILKKESRVLVDPDYNRDERYAYYQALKIGLQELYLERGGVSRIQRGRESTEGGYLQYYCTARDAFGIADDESLSILREVLGELHLQNRLLEDMSRVQAQQQFNWGDADLCIFPDFKEMVELAPPEQVEAEGSLFRFHKGQYRVAENITNWVRGRLQGHRGGWERLQNHPSRMAIT